MALVRILKDCYPEELVRGKVEPWNASFLFLWKSLIPPIYRPCSTVVGNVLGWISLKSYGILFSVIWDTEVLIL